MAHICLPGQLAAGVGGKIEGFEVLAAPLQLPRQVALSRRLSRPRPCRQHLHTTTSTLHDMHAVRNSGARDGTMLVETRQQKHAHQLGAATT